MEIRVGRKCDEAIRAVQARNFDLVIKESDEIEWYNHFLGNDDMNLLRKFPCPVWLMKKNEKPKYEHIMVAVDFDADHDEDVDDRLNEKIIGLASSIAFADFTSLHVVNIYDVPET